MWIFALAVMCQNVRYYVDETSILNKILLDIWILSLVIMSQEMGMRTIGNLFITSLTCRYLKEELLGVWILDLLIIYKKWGHLQGVSIRAKKSFIVSLTSRWKLISKWNIASIFNITFDE